MQWVLLLAISSFKNLRSSDWFPVFNKYKNANSNKNTNTKMQRGLLLAISSFKNLGSCDWSPVFNKLHLPLSLHQPQTWTKWGLVKVNGCYITWTCLILLRERRCTFMYKYSWNMKIEDPSFYDSMIQFHNSNSNLCCCYVFQFNWMRALEIFKLRHHR